MIYLAVVSALQIALVAYLLHDRHAERQEVRRERADLLQRISAPEHAAIQHYNDHLENHSPPAVNPEIDEDYWVGKDDLAEMMAHEETANGDRRD
jgi:hypothetical protein